MMKPISVRNTSLSIAEPRSPGASALLNRTTAPNPIRRDGPRREARHTSQLAWLGFLLLSAFVAASAAVQNPQDTSASAVGQTDRQAAIPAAEFARIVNEFSEDGGYFWSENLISNETSYLHIVPNLRELGATGGAYIGVGPEQNFTYIAKIRPQIAFVVDIRRQAMIQHLMFKALFHLSPDRRQFLSRLISRPIAGKDAPAPGAALDRLIEYFSKASPDAGYFASNLVELKTAITREFLVPLAPRDEEALEHVYKSFRDDGLDISFRLDGSGFGPWSGYFPSLKQLISERDLSGNVGNFLADSSDYDFVRGMHERNRIIPIVGDFAGPKALAAVGAYLRKNGYVVSVFYASNVEQYLFESSSFAGFVANVRKLPSTDKSLMIRTVFDIYRPHPSQKPGHHVTTLIQRMPLFLKDYEKGIFQDYWSLVTTDFIGN
jgi:hypothetical protein